MAETAYCVLSANQDLEEWDSFVSRSPQGNLFCKSWWLRAAFAANFEVLVARRAGAIVAGIPLPYAISGRRRRFIRPPMTTSMGVLLSPNPTNALRYEQQLSSEMNLLNGLVAAIPDNDGFRVAFHPTFSNWLPFYWQGYQQTTFYTYVFEDISDIDKIVRGMNHSKRKNLKKAERLVRAEREMDTESFYFHHKKTLKQEGNVISYKLSYLKRIVEAARENAGVEVLSAVDSAGIIHAAIVVIFDSVSAYYVASSIDPDLRRSGSTTFLILEAIKIVSVATNRFDFEGSMIPGVERSFRKFGARQTSHFVISKDESWRLQLRTAAERIARKFGIRE